MANTPTPTAPTAPAPTQASPQAAAAAIQTATSPAATANPTRRERIPFNNFTKKLEVIGDIPGYHLYWFLDDGDRIPRALDGGYDFVKRGELELNGGVVASNADLGDKISRLAGKHANGDPAYLILMKIPLELWQEDQKALEAHNDRIRQSLMQGAIGNAEQVNSYTSGSPMTGKGPSVTRDLAQLSKGANPTGQAAYKSRFNT